MPDLIVFFKHQPGECLEEAARIAGTNDERLLVAKLDPDHVGKCQQMAGQLPQLSAVDADGQGMIVQKIANLGQRPDGGNTVISMPPFGPNTIPPQAVDISIAFFLTVAAIIIGLPLARAFARRMDRRGGTAPISNEIASQLNHLNQAVDAIALEVERISEGQRFTARLLSDERDRARQTLPSGAE